MALRWGVHRLEIDGWYNKCGYVIPEARLRDLCSKVSAKVNVRITNITRVGERGVGEVPLGMAATRTGLAVVG